MIIVNPVKVFEISKKKSFYSRFWEIIKWKLKRAK